MNSQIDHIKRIVMKKSSRTLNHLSHLPYRLSLILFFLSFGVQAQQSSPVLISPQQADTWAATDALGRSLPTNPETGDLREDKFVGIFYFLWLGAHGHDEHSRPPEGEGVWPKEEGKTYASPYDISKILEANPDDPQYGPDKAFHHWGEPYYGYYLSDDEWVIVKHAQLLSDAGVDVIVFDITNGLAYLPIALKVCNVFSRLQQRGWAVPKVAFLTNSAHVTTTNKMYEGFYKEGLYEDLWFRWKGKPLLMGNPEGLSPEITEFFNFRRSWAWTEGQEWFGDGKDKWPWIDHYPQNYGWHDDPDTPEQIVVASAQHPVSNIGRSFHDGHQPPPDSIDPGAGWFFAEQWKRALEVDPEFVFITGWNEWVAMRFTDGRAKQIMGKPIKKGETFFVDQYNEEFSRDIEPMKGGFGDNYYYQMVDGIRKFKGTRAGPQVQGGVRISIDGTFDDWTNINNVYYDHAGDTRRRDHPGWGRIEAYKNNSGRYDLHEARATEDEGDLAFYLLIDGVFPDNQVPPGTELLLESRDMIGERNLGYTHRLIAAAAAGAMDLQMSKGGWQWSTIAQVPVAVKDGELELRFPKILLKAATGEVHFKWIDNVQPDGDAMRFYDQGDSAPNARFNYRFEFNAN
jgi:hypothetical protein